MPRRKLPFTNAELREMARAWIAHFGHLEELPKIRAALELVADRLESISIMLGSPRR